MHSLYAGPMLELLSTLYVLSAVKLMMETVSYQLGASSLSGSFCNSCSNDTCKTGTVGAK